MENYNKILVIQTAFIGDVILVTSLLETLHNNHPYSTIDIVVRKGNESLFNKHPFLGQIYVWDKKNNKTKNLFTILKNIRKEGYDLTLGVQRFFNAGLLTAFSKGKMTIGFDKNPLSFLFKKKIKHQIGTGLHEIERNFNLISSFNKKLHKGLKLYPTDQNLETTSQYKKEKYIVIAPASVWFTKQYPKEKWIEFLNRIEHIKTFIIGAPSDKALAKEIIENSSNPNIYNLCGELNLLESAALMKDAQMCYVNDSAPQHLASSVNAPTTTLFCSTVPSFGFGPLSDDSIVIEVEKPLDCKPCGLHGHKSCPKEHFKCGFDIDTSRLTARINRP